MFSRSRASGRHARADRSRRDPAAAGSTADDLEVADATGGAGDAAGGDAEPEAPELPSASGPDDSPDGPSDSPGGPSDSPGGPYDASEAPAGVRRLDLGSLQIPMVSGVEVRVQPGKDGAVQRVFLLNAKSTLELGVFAAPRSEPIWDEVRTDIRKSLFDEGVAAEEAGGPYGTELRARVRTNDGLMDLRFVGVDGPRWMVRAVYRGPAAVDPAKAGPLAECLGGLVVDRGDQARPVKEPLPLRLPEELAAKLPEGAQGVRVPGATDAGGPPAGGPPAGGRTPANGAVPSGSTSITATGSTAGGSTTGGSPGGGSTTGGSSGGGNTTATGAPRRRKPSPRPRRQGPGTGSAGA